MSRAAAVIALILLGPARSEASYHLAHISEVMSGVTGDPSVQYVEIRMDSGFQNLVGNTRLTAFDCAGATATVLLTIPPPTAPGGSVPNQGAGRHWIMGTSSLAARTTPSVTPDFTFPPGIPAACGMVCWGGPIDPVTGFSKDPSTWAATDPNNYVDCVAYGPYTGPQRANAGSPASATPGGRPQPHAPVGREQRLRARLPHPDQQRVVRRSRGERQLRAVHAADHHDHFD